METQSFELRESGPSRETSLFRFARTHTKPAKKLLNAGTSDVANSPRKRPRDPAQLAKLMIDIASGEVEDRPPALEEQGKDSAAAALGLRTEYLPRRLRNANPKSINVFRDSKFIIRVWN
jgi:hypothetical protein